MKYTSTLYVVATKNQPISIETDLGTARQVANGLALDNPGRDYIVFEWRNGERWQDHKTQYAYRGFVSETKEQYIERVNQEARTEAAIKAIRDMEWGRLDSERGHANMQTAHNQLLNWK